MYTLKSIAQKYNIDLVQPLAVSGRTASERLDAVRALVGVEGCVVRFANGEQYKCKADEYVAMHRTVSFLHFEKDIVRVIFEEKSDDLKPLLAEDMLQKFVEFEANILQAYSSYMSQLYWRALAWLDNNNFSNKAYAVNFVKAEKEAIPNVLHGVLFSAVDAQGELVTEPEFLDRGTAVVVRNCSQQKKVDEIRFLLGNHRWEL